MFSAGQVVVTEGNTKNFLSRAVMWFTGSTYTHAFLVVDEETGIESKFPGVLQFWKPSVVEFNLADRLAHLAEGGRGYIVLDDPTINPAQRKSAIWTARRFLGRRYDVLQALIYAACKQFILNGSGRMECGRMITAAYWEGPGIALFTIDSVPPDHPRRENMYCQYGTPHELVHYTRMKGVAVTTP